jgi:hypothetical protein
MPWYHDFKYLINTLLVGYYLLKNQYPIDTLMGTYHLIGVGYLIFIQNVHPFFSSKDLLSFRVSFFFPYTYLTLNHKLFFHVSLEVLHPAMFFN